jgi:hypothetical protein
MRYNPPPTWPTPPTGWVPPPGWQPDPTWGPPPEGWQVWVEDKKRPWVARHKVLTAIGALVVFAIIGAVSNGGKSPATTAVDTTSAAVVATKPAAAPSSSSSSAPAPAPAAVTTTTQAPPPPAPSATTKTEAPVQLTASQEQAVGAARDYLSFQAFSRKGLIRQLSSNAGSGFSTNDATFAVDSLTVNWNEQAAKSAKDYLSFQHFSRSGLIEQLESSAGSGFTHAQAVYGVNKAGL